MNRKWGDVQVNREHYISNNYLDKARFMGLFGQINLFINQTFSGNLLEIGPGPGLFSAIMRQLGYSLTTIDYAHDLQTDILGRLPELPLLDQAFDVVCAFEVLEHIPFRKIYECFLEMSRVSRSIIIVSVPNVKEFKSKFKFNMEIKINNIKFRKKINLLRQNKLGNPKEHYWELGIHGIDEEKLIKEAKKAELDIIQNEFIEPWFHFFVFKKQ